MFLLFYFFEHCLDNFLNKFLVYLDCFQRYFEPLMVDFY